MVLLVLLSVPVMISALKEIKIVVTSNIEIEKVNLKSFTFRNYYDYGNLSKYKSKKYDFEEGMTFEEWLDSKYNVDHIEFEDAGIVTDCTDYENSIFINSYYGSERYKELIFGDDYVLGSYNNGHCYT